MVFFSGLATVVCGVIFDKIVKKREIEKKHKIESNTSEGREILFEMTNGFHNGFKISDF